MKQIELLQGKTTVLVKGEDTEVDINTIQLLETAISNSPQGGFTVQEMMDRLNVKGKLKIAIEKKYDILELEDAEFKALGGWFHAVKWAFPSQFIIDLDQQFK